MKEEDRRDHRRHFYDVERFQKIYQETMKRRGRLGRIAGRITWSLGSMQGLFIALLAFPLMLGTFLAVILGAVYGPFAFLALFGSIIGGIAFYVDRKVGPSLQFGEYKLLRRMFGQFVGFLLMAGVILFLVVLTRFRPF